MRMEDIRWINFLATCWHHQIISGYCSPIGGRHRTNYPTMIQRISNQGELGEEYYYDVLYDEIIIWCDNLEYVSRLIVNRWWLTPNVLQDWFLESTTGSSQAIHYPWWFSTRDRSIQVLWEKITPWRPMEGKGWKFELLENLGCIGDLFDSSQTN